LNGVLGAPDKAGGYPPRCMYPHEKYDLSDRNLGLNVYHPDLSRVHVRRAHGFQSFVCHLNQDTSVGSWSAAQREPRSAHPRMPLSMPDGLHIVAARKGDL